MDAIRARLSVEPDVWLFRNQVAKVQHLGDGRIELVGAGLGSPDLMGAVAGHFIWLEIKPPKKAHRDKAVLERQERWRETVARPKGLTGAVVTSVADALQVVEQARLIVNRSSLA